MAYDSTREKTVLCNGGEGTYTSCEVWERDGTSWSQRQPATMPSVRWASVPVDQIVGLSVVQ